MEKELKCPICNFWYKKALLLPCGHSVCSQCATNVVREITDSTLTANDGINLNNALLISNAAITNEQDSDHLSETSEADSGVVLNNTSNLHHPTTLNHAALHNTANANANSNFLHVNNRPSAYYICCPNCSHVILLDASGLDCLLENRALDRVVEKYRTKLGGPSSGSDRDKVICQICCNSNSTTSSGNSSITNSSNNSTEESIEATHFCEQCQIAYCHTCLNQCHPNRGPFAQHRVVSAQQIELSQSGVFKKLSTTNRNPSFDALATKNRGIIPMSNESREQRQQESLARSSQIHPNCPCHGEGEKLSLFCTHCRMIICGLCVQQFHLQHEIHSIDVICKQQKTELSQQLQSLSEKAKSGMQFVHSLRSLSDKMNKKCIQKEHDIISSIDELIGLLKDKKQDLLQNLKDEKNNKTTQFKHYIHSSTAALGRANVCIQFCIEMLKETDAASFLLISNSLLLKVNTIEQMFIQEIEPKIQNGCDFNLQISDSDRLQQMIGNLKLSEVPVEYYSSSIANEYQSNDAPKPPIFWPEQCFCTNNIFTVLWQPYPGPPVQYYTLEIDDGAGGAFRRVYRGSDCVCTVEGLHFDSLYGVRVRAHNQNGDSAYSDVIWMQTGKLTVFTMQHKLNPPEIMVSNSGLTITTDSVEDRVCIGSTGFSRGVHYWEFLVDRIDTPDTQPAFGVARSDCRKDEMLGIDEKGWSMYINDTRSWFLHQHEHFERTDGGIKAGSLVGVRLDCDKGYLSYYVNEEPHGPIAFTKLLSSSSTNWNNTLTSTNSSSGGASSQGSVPGRSPNFYPAVSLNRSTQLTLVVGREPPSESGDSSEDDDTASTAILVPM